VSEQTAGLLVPAYTIPYAIAGLLCGALADRIGRRGLLFFSLAAFPATSLLLASAPTIHALIYIRILSGACNAGIAVMGLTLVGELFPPTDRGRAIGWVFGGIAGGGAFGSTLGGVLAPVIGWRGLFVLTAAIGFILLLRILPLWRSLAIPTPTSHSAAELLSGYLELVQSPRGAKTYSFIFANAIFHSGVFTWIGVHLHERYGLGAAGIGLTLLGYGIPGFLLGPVIGRWVDRFGRRYFIPAGFLIAASAAALLIPNTPLAVAIVAAPLLSLGFDMTHPLLAGIVTTFNTNRRGQAMGLNAFAIFLGFGVGSLLFGGFARQGTAHALAIFAAAQALLSIAAYIVFRSE
jgi:predicted MFS family arabinose efflux permease